MAEIPVYAETPSALADPRIVAPVVGDAWVSWHPERGWLCSATGHHVQPCEHTVDLVAVPSETWGQ